MQSELHEFLSAVSSKVPPEKCIKRLSMMIKVSNSSGLSSWPQVLDLGKAGEEQITSRRAPPSEPLAFFEGHECGKRIYTNGADRDLILAPHDRVIGL